LTISATFEISNGRQQAFYPGVTSVAVLDRQLTSRTLTNRLDFIRDRDYAVDSRNARGSAKCGQGLTIPDGKHLVDLSLTFQDVMDIDGLPE
jgi:hypothetical protein